ncbi:MAG: gamma-glutamyl-gamma-aminobutyrate hydrolase family protein [Armatimonadota bacterium]
MKPRIGVLCNHSDDGSGAFSERQLVNQPYLDRIADAGGASLLIHDAADDEIVALLELCDGLLVTGGPDVDPRSYDSQPHAKLGSISPRRDHLDRVAVRYALDRPALPMLGICRGVQSINVIAGGSLLQDVGSQVEGALKHKQEAPGWFGTHDIEVAEGSLLAELCGVTQLSVNSYHHQAVEDVAPGFEVVARSEDGVVEATERRDGTFCLGLQFHPEIMADRDACLMRIFTAFVDACR